MSVSNSLIHVSNQEGKLGMYHVTMEIWIEPKLGTCQKGPEIAKGKDFLKIANDQFTRDHQLIIMETTFNRLKDRLKQELENDKRGVTMEDDRDHDLDQARIIHKMSSVSTLVGHTFFTPFGSKRDILTNSQIVSIGVKTEHAVQPPGRTVQI